MTDPRNPDTNRETLSRRTFLKGAGGVAAGGVLSGELLAQEQGGDDGGVQTLEGELKLNLDINGRKVELTAEPRTTLLSALRHRIDPPLTGSKEVCDQGNCGACTVLIDGKPAYACMQLAVLLVGKKITTVEGLGSSEAMSPVQAAFCKHDALMCGFCTPGFVVATTAALAKNPAAGREEIQQELSGNLCRCGTYPHIFDAAKTAGIEMQGEKR